MMKLLIIIIATLVMASGCTKTDNVQIISSPILKHETNPPIEAAFRDAIMNQHINGDITYEPEKEKISFRVVQKEAINKTEAETLINTILEDVSSITGQSNAIKLMDPYSLEFQILQSSMDGNVLFRGLKKKNSSDLQWL